MASIWFLRTKPFLRYLIPTVLWLALGFSLGWYYTFTYYGRSGWPMPIPEGCAALILYYFSVLNVSTEIQAVHWIIVFPVAGWLWVSSLDLVDRFFRGEQTPKGHLSLAFALTSLPLSLPGPLISWWAGQTDGGFSGERMVEVALRRGWVHPLRL